jgi:hypothetical protein
MAPIRRLHALLKAHHQSKATPTKTSQQTTTTSEAEADQHLALLKPLLQPISAAFRRFVLDRYFFCIVVFCYYFYC